MNFDFGNVSLELTLLISSSILVVSVLASRISSSWGVPALLIFLGIGMFAGSEGPIGVPFENYNLSFAVGSVCLAIIMFDGGLRTSWKSVRPILPVGISLSVLGTVITGIATGIFAHYVLNLSWLEGLLLGAIVSSTDAAAVFSILRSKGLGLKGKLKQTLEFEAGSNDPIAVFLTVAILSLMGSDQKDWSSVVVLLVQQASLGLIFGFYGARFIRFLMNRSGIEFEGLYGVLAVGLALALFSATAYLGGSGFLALYVAGLMLGRREFLHKISVIRFLDGIAWISQILIFLVLGLLVFPSNLLKVWKEGLLIAFFMMLVARPLSVFVASYGKSFNKQERLFVSWIGLRGAAPIILATLPWSRGVANAEFLFNLVFFVVLISVAFQGMSIPWVANKLNVTAPLPDNDAEEPDFNKPLPTGSVHIEATLATDAPAVQKRIVDLGLPADVFLTSIDRGGRYLIPQGNTVLEAGDKIQGFARPGSKEALRQLFGKLG